MDGRSFVSRDKAHFANLGELLLHIGSVIVTYVVFRFSQDAFRVERELFPEAGAPMPMMFTPVTDGCTEWAFKIGWLKGMKSL